jgi:moderate conductance mechanosensitive channel
VANLNIDFHAYLAAAGHWLLTTGLKLVLIVVGLLLAQKAAGLIIARILDGIGRRKEDAEYQKRTDTLKAVVRYLASTVLFTVAAMMILGQLGIEIGPILAAAGVVGLAVGFGAQNLVKDVLAGFFILLEDQIRVGDVVEVVGQSGLVEQISLRLLTLRDLAGNVHYIRNGNIDVVTNMTKEYSRYVFEVGVAYREDADEVMGVLAKLDEELRADPEFGGDILAPLEILGVDAFADSAVIIKARTTTKPIQQWRIGREFNRRMKRRFDELGIEIPFPHVTIYAGQEKHGNAPPVHVRVDGNGRDALGLGG